MSPELTYHWDTTALKLFYSFYIYISLLLDHLLQSYAHIAHFSIFMCVLSYFRAHLRYVQCYGPVCVDLLSCSRRHKSGTIQSHAQMFKNSNAQERYNLESCALARCYSPTEFTFYFPIIYLMIWAIARAFLSYLSIGSSRAPGHYLSIVTSVK